MGVTGVPGFQRRTKFACPSGRNPLFSLSFEICFANIHHRNHHRHYIILVYRAGGLACFKVTGHGPPPVHDPGRCTPAGLKGWEDTKGRGARRGDHWCLLLSFFACGVPRRKVFENGRQHTRSVHLCIGSHIHKHNVYVVWYQGASVDICRNTCVASVEKRTNISKTRVDAAQF